MKKYMDPEVDIKKFLLGDVITTSDEWTPDEDETERG